MRKQPQVICPSCSLLRGQTPLFSSLLFCFNKHFGVRADAGSGSFLSELPWEVGKPGTLSCCRTWQEGVPRGRVRSISTGLFSIGKFCEEAFLHPPSQNRLGVSSSVSSHANMPRWCAVAGSSRSESEGPEGYVSALVTSKGTGGCSASPGQEPHPPE